MKFLNYKSLIILFVLLFNNSFSQDAAIYNWKEYMPYRYAVSINTNGSKIFCATRFNIFTYNINDGTYEYITKLKGLSDVEIKSSAFNKENQILIIGYDNGNIDLLMANNAIINIPDLKNKQSQYSKSIKNIFTNGNFAYLSTGIGVIVLDLAKKEIKDTYSLYNNLQLLSINDFVEFNDKFYAATERGIFYINKNAPVLSNYQFWTLISDMPYAEKNFSNIEVFENKLFANYKPGSWNGDGVFYLDNNEWKRLENSIYSMNNNISSSANHLFLSRANDVVVYDKTLNILNTLSYNSNFITTYPRDVLEDKNGNFWIADGAEGLMKYIKNNNYFESHTPNSPMYWFASSFAFTPEKVYVSLGSKNTSWENAWIQGILMTYENDLWDTLKYVNMSVFDINNVIVNPQNHENVFAACFGKGIIELKNKKISKIYDTTNSTLRPPLAWASSIQCYGMAFDKDNNFWATTMLTSSLLNVRKPNGSWKSFNFNGIAARVSNVMIDKINQKWITLPKSTGIIVFNDNNTIDNTADDHFKLLNTAYGNGNLPSTNINAVVCDKDGKVWVGTQMGLVVFYNPENIFSKYNFDAQPITIEQDGKPQHLMGAENVTAIAVDAANRKWIGTQSAGVFLFSPDGQKEIYHFNIDNSPLLSNSIIAIGINPYNGEVFISTDNCIVSFKGDAIDGFEKYTEVLAYPNPVKEDYDGPIAIKGLITDSDVKITDVNGNLVYITKALGGQAIWNGKDLNNNKVNTGVYLVFCANEDGSETMVTKILFLKR